MAKKAKGKAKAKAYRRKPKACPKGIFEGNAKGFGFIKTSEGDFFIPRSGVNGAMDGDTVEVSIASRGPKGRGSSRSGGSNRPEARVVQILERAHGSLIGRYEIAGPFGVVVPDDPRIAYDIFTKRSDDGSIADGALVRVRILDYPTRKSSAFGIVDEVIGDSDDISLLSSKIIARYGFETAFPPEALEEAAECHVDVARALAEGYRDLRSRFIFTIDPADARDFDDALSIEEVFPEDFADLDILFLDDPQLLKGIRGPILRLGVHIADVSNYVVWDGAIDRAAQKRTTSVYLPDRVLPMIPESLSNGICSLMPNEARRAFSVDIYVTPSMDLVGYDPFPSVIESKRRLTYEEAAKMIEEGSSEEGDGELIEALRLASEVAKKRAKRRESQGGLEFHTAEAKVTLDEVGYPTGVKLRSKTVSTSLVEEAMIFANEVVADHLFRASWPCAYRVHENPDLDALTALVPVFQEFKWFTKEMAYGLSVSNPHTIQDILDQSSGRVEGELVSMLLLRAMKRAAYSPDNIGHFGIGSNAYCHFTSPIRRYPDLIVHRMLKANLAKRGERFDSQVKAIKELCDHSSKCERDAEAASMDATKAYIAYYMQDKVGQEFDGIITGVTSYGLYVRVDDFAEGLVPIRTLGDEYFHFDEVRYTLTGDTTRRVYRLGQRVEVVLSEVDKVNYHIDFKLLTASRR